QPGRGQGGQQGLRSGADGHRDGESAEATSRTLKHPFLLCFPRLPCLAILAQEPSSLFPPRRYRAFGRKWAMRRGAWLLILLVSVAGCVTTDDERVRDYSADGLHLFQCG